MADDLEFERLSQMLPFYVNGTLGAKDCARIDAALCRSAALRNELAVIGRLAHGVKAGGREMAQGDDERVERVAAELEQLAPNAVSFAGPNHDGFVAHDKLAGLLRFLHPKRWHPVVALGLGLAIIAQFGVISSLRGDKAERTSKIASLEKRIDEVEFQLASGPGGEDAPQGSLIVQLNPSASWADFERLLANEALVIVGGPSDGSLILASESKGAALDAQIARLRRSAIIEAVDKVA